MDCKELHLKIRCAITLEGIKIFFEKNVFILNTVQIGLPEIIVLFHLHPMHIQLDADRLDLIRVSKGVPLMDRV